MTFKGNVYFELMASRCGIVSDATTISSFVTLQGIKKATYEDNAHEQQAIYSSLPRQKPADDGERLITDESYETQEHSDIVTTSVGE
ncbi:hypothetical protein WAI453_007220 [Rhynchosporium graminicola]